jgi:hypothetical protein
LALVGRLVIVGGLAPSLLIALAHASGDTHVGTMDLDVGLQLGLSPGASFHPLARRLSDGGFAPGTGDDGEKTPYWWVSQPHRLQVDFLSAPRRPEVRLCG